MVGFKYIVSSLILAIGLSVPDVLLYGKDNPIDYVDPFIGASTSIGKAKVYHGLGKTFPGATTPYGMVQLNPNTVTGGDNGSGYSYEMETIEGFAFTQMSGVGWYGDLGNFLVMPTRGEMKTIAGKEDGSIKGWRSRYDKKTESASVGYYSVNLTDYDVVVECTASPHCGVMRMTFPEDTLSRIQIDLARRVGGTSEEQNIRVLNDSTISGWMKCTPETGGWGNGSGNPNYTVFFYARFSKPFKKYGFWNADIPDGWSRKRDDVTSIPYLEKVREAPIFRDSTEITGKHIGFFTEFPTVENEEVVLKVGISFVDENGAKGNFYSEVAFKDFDEVYDDAVELWGNELGRIRVYGGSEKDKRIFYTALYHSMIDPRIYSDVDGRYIGGDYEVHDNTDGRFIKRTVFSGWDVFRSLMPLNTIINPEVISDLINSLTELAEQSGRNYFERWEFFNSYSGCMIGNPAISVLADAYVKGIRSYDIDKAYKYAVNSSEKFSNYPLGWKPGGTCISETLEYAYTDWCLSVLAGNLGYRKDAAKYMDYSQAYRNIFDFEKGWFRPRNSDGTWADWPDGARLHEGYGCIECNPYQQGWFVPHDIAGMVEIMGGRDKVLKDLDYFFEHTPSDMLWNMYYNHANEPVHFIPFLFNRLNEPWKTQKWTRFICNNAYSDGVDGLVGNDDAGQMSAWYVLTSSGIHPICPGDATFEITSPVFRRVEFCIGQSNGVGKIFTIIAENNSPENIYIQSATLNGIEHNVPRISYHDIMKGGTLILNMGPVPSDWGTVN